MSQLEKTKGCLFSKHFNTSSLLLQARGVLAAIAVAHLVMIETLVLQANKQAKTWE
jgi:hypothetical protein